MKEKKNYQHYEFIRQFHTLNRQPAYLIYGEDAFQKDIILKMIVEKYSDTEMDDFDFITFYGDEYPANKKPIDVLEQLESLPFLTKNKIIVLKNFDKMTADNLMMIAEYLENPVKTSLLILVGNKLDKRFKAGKIIADIALNIQCYPPYNASSIMKWLNTELSRQKIKMETNALELFANSIELDFMIASTELEKLIIYTHNSRNISIDDVEETVGKSKKNKIFDLQNSIGKKNLKKALSIIENMFSHTSEKIGIYVVTMLTRYFITIWKVAILRDKNLSDSEITSRYLKNIYFKFRNDYLNAADHYSVNETKNILSILMNADYDLKSKNIDEKIILETMIINICKGY